MKSSARRSRGDRARERASAGGRPCAARTGLSGDAGVTFSPGPAAMSAAMAVACGPERNGLTICPGLPERALGTTRQRLFGGAQGGCNYQTGSWVFGIQGDYDWAHGDRQQCQHRFSRFSPTGRTPGAFLTYRPSRLCLGSLPPLREGRRRLGAGRLLASCRRLHDRDDERDARRLDGSASAANTPFWTAHRLCRIRLLRLGHAHEHVRHL